MHLSSTYIYLFMCLMLIKYLSRDPKVPIVILSINNNNLLAGTSGR